MKIRLLAVTLAMALLLSGCTSLFQRSYYSSTDHADYTVEEDSSVLRAESYRGLVDAVLYFVNEHLSRGVVRLYNYTGDVDADLAAACLEITREDPLSAYAVEDISYEYSRIVSYYEVTVSVTFAHSQAEIDAIQSVPGVSAIRPLLDEAMEQFASDLTLRVSYFSGDEETLHAMASQAYYAAPQSAFGMPELDITFYPDSGSQRIVELTLRWPDEKKTLEMRSEELVSAADLFLASNPPTEDSYSPGELAELFQLLSPLADTEGSEDPYAVFAGTSATQSARMLSLSLLFHRAGLDATYVSGFSGADEICWLIVAAEDTLCHLLLTGEEILLLSDAEMTGLGYLWRTDLYPVCPGLPAVEGTSFDKDADLE